MKLLETIYCLLVLALLSSCINDDLSDCPSPYTAKFTFSYTGNADTPQEDLFPERVDRVTLLVFDKESGAKIVSKTIDKTELLSQQSTTLDLDPGTYKIVCWGNAFADTQITDNSLTSGSVNHPNYSLGTNIPTNDHLYYKTCEITVPETGNVLENIPFTGAHINLEIFVSGFGNAANTESYPVIEVSGLMPQYTMEMGNAQPFTTTYYPEVKYNNTLKMNEAIFQTLRFADNNNVVITLKNKTGEVKHTVNLRQYMIDNNIHIDGKNEATISMKIEFGDLGITVTLPEWSGEEIIPE